MISDGRSSGPDRKDVGAARTGRSSSSLDESPVDIHFAAFAAGPFAAFSTAPLDAFAATPFAAFSTDAFFAGAAFAGAAFFG